MRRVTAAEIRTAVRSLSRAPTVTICALLCLSVGIGATTAFSAAIKRALLQPPPFHDADRLVAVHRVTPQSGPQGSWSLSPANYADLAREATQIEGLAAVTSGVSLVRVADEAVRVIRLSITGTLFPTLGARAQLGRLIGPGDDRPGQPPVVVLGDELWRGRFGADPGVVGTTVAVDGTPTTIVGIAPREFRIPHGGNLLRADLWLPIRFTPEQLAQRRNNYLLFLGRLAPAASVQSADSEMRRLFGNLAESYPALRGENLRVAPLRAENLDSVRTPLLLLFGAVCMVLLIAATNVAALLLARGVQRQREMAVRTALGATRGDALRPVLIESFILAAASVIAGIGLAQLGIKTIGLLAAARMPHLDGMRLDGGVLAFALVLSVAVAMVCGAAPAWRAARVDPQDAVRGGRGGGSGREHHRALRGLVVTEIALSLVLLIGAGLVLKGFAKLMANEPGFDTDRILTVQVTTSGSRYPDQTSARRFLEPALAQVRAVPGVEAAGAISLAPYLGWGTNMNVRYEGEPVGDPSQQPIVEQRAVSPGFFDVTQQRLIAGRYLTPGDDDRPGTPQVVVVNEALVKRDFAGRNPIGRRFHLTDTSFATIVGVMSDIRNVGPMRDPDPEMYWTYRQRAPGPSSFPLMIRVGGRDPAAVAAGVRTAIHSVDPTAAVSNVTSMNDVIARSLGRPRFYFSVMGTFAGIAVILAVAGLYGVLSYAVAQRTREIGIRAALGSSRGALMRLIAMDGFRLVAAGVALGLAGGAAVTRLMEFMLYGVSPLDARAWAAAVAVMAAAAMLAALVPAWRAGRADPLVAIRSE